VTEIRQVGLEDFGPIYRRLLANLNPSIGEDGWKRLFNCRWAGADPHAGYGLYDDGEPVGFIGLLFGERYVNGRRERFCNVTTWVVEPAYRNHAVSLLMPVVRLKDCTVTNLTSIPAVHKIFSSLGFRTLEDHVRIAWPVPWSPGPPDLQVEFDADVIAGMVAPDWQTIVRDHQRFGPLMLLRSEGRSTLAVYRIGRWRRLRVARIHHLEGGDLFREALGSVKWALFRRHGAVILQMDDRLWPMDTRWTTRVKLPVPRLYKSAALQPADVTNLYSELVLLPL
jgi:hypothetical protein